MSQLTVFDDLRPDAPLLRTEDAAAMARELAAIGVRFEHWDSPVALPADATPEAILAAYRPYLDQLMGDVGAGSADVVSLTPEHPEVPALRRKFLAEHIHTEDEIRFFVRGGGHFVMHANGRVYDAYCAAGDLIAVPARMRHWFDAGPAPSFTALRVFTDSAGWVAHFTGETISERFPVA